MFSWKKIAAVSGLLGGLAVTTCVGAAHAHEGGSSGGCTLDARGNINCIQKSETRYTAKNGKSYVLRQVQRCSAPKPRDYVVRPDSGLGAKGITKIGSVLECNNSAPAARSFKLPH